MSLTELLFSGSPLAGEVVIDDHCHMGPWSNFHIAHDGSPAAMVELMDRLGIDAAWISPHVGIGPDSARANRDAYQAAADFPARLFPYVIVNPNHGRGAAEAEIAHWVARGGIRAFKLHPGTHQYKATGEAYVPVFEYADAHRLPVLIHSWSADRLGGPPILAELARNYPNAQILIAHSATNWQMLDEACEAALACPNISLDIAGSGLHAGLLEEMVRRVSAERILFGTDSPFLDPRPQVGRVLLARISDDEKRLIFGLNARRLFGLG